jgi:hypothetical protein
MDWRFEKRREAFDKLQQLVVDIVQPEKWGFRESYRYVDVKAMPYVIYDSEWCRVRFSRTSGDEWQEAGIDVSYGRLHALNDVPYIIWKDEKCRSWHQVYDALRFLDGMTANEAVNQIQEKKEWPKIAHPYREGIMENHDKNNGEWVLRLHAAIWLNYGKRFFELFDLRHPQLWEQYRAFLKEMYDIKGRNPRIIPAMDQVC